MQLTILPFLVFIRKYKGKILISRSPVSTPPALTVIPCLLVYAVPGASASFRSCRTEQYFRATCFMDSKNSGSVIFSETVLKTSGQIRDSICSEDTGKTAAAFIPAKIMHHVQAVARPTVFITTGILMQPISGASVPGADSRLQ